MTSRACRPESGLRLGSRASGPILDGIQGMHTARHRSTACCPYLVPGARWTAAVADVMQVAVRPEAPWDLSRSCRALEICAATAWLASWDMLRYVVASYWLEIASSDI